jgi:hypothetical protein
MMDTTAPTSFERLVSHLPSLARAPGVRPWDAMRVLRWLCTDGISHGEALAARLALGVWDSTADWTEEARTLGLPCPQAAKRFDVLEAAATWDEPHLAALRAWLRAPEFP